MKAVSEVPTVQEIGSDCMETFGVSLHIHGGKCLHLILRDLRHLGQPI